jgi:hypothetical protein
MWGVSGGISLDACYLISENSICDTTGLGATGQAELGWAGRYVLERFVFRADTTRVSVMGIWRRAWLTEGGLYSG